MEPNFLQADVTWEGGGGDKLGSEKQSLADKIVKIIFSRVYLCWPLNTDPMPLSYTHSGWSEQMGLVPTSCCCCCFGCSCPADPAL